MAANEPLIEPRMLELVADTNRSVRARSAFAHLQRFSALFWMAIFVVHTSQASFSEGAVDWQALRWRTLMHTLYFALSLPVGWVIVRTFAQSLPRRIVAILAVSALAAVGYSSVNRFVWVTLAGATQTTPALLAVLINAHYGLVLFLLWSVFCSAILYAFQARERERRLLEAQALAHAAELKMLRYQINPHFLFNTLNAVSALIVTGQTLAAEQMVAKLARFFRTALSRESTAKVTLTEEWRVQLEYLSIELTRFPERLRWSTRLAPEVVNALVPHLILQPLFENAIKHGVARSNDPVEIRLSADRCDGGIAITVENDLPKQPSTAAAAGESVGLANVARRLSAFYGDAASVETLQRDGRFVVELKLPLERTL